MEHYKRGGRLIAGILIVYTVLVLFHLGHFGSVWPAGEPRHELGEFWPFSIYPMFSQGGNPWVRTHMREVPDLADPDLWHNRSFDDLLGTPYALGPRGINQNDIANFISKTRTWNERRVAGIRSVFEGDLQQKNLLIYRADGSITDGNVSVVFTPFLLMASDTTYFNPDLDISTGTGASP